MLQSSWVHMAKQQQGLLGQGIKNSEMSAAESAAFQEGGCMAVLIGTEDLYGALEQKFDGFVTGPMTVLRSMTVWLPGVAAQHALCSSANTLLSGGAVWMPWPLRKSRASRASVQVADRSWLLQLRWGNGSANHLM